MVRSATRPSPPRKRGSIPAVPTRPLDLSATPPFRILALASRFTAQFASVYSSRFGLGLPEWRTLTLLGLRGPMPAARIAELAMVDRGLISRAVIALEAAGLVMRIDHPTDGRAQVVGLTQRGAELHDRIADLHLRRQERLLERFTNDEGALLLDFLARIDAALDDLVARPVILDPDESVPPRPGKRSPPGSTRRGGQRAPARKAIS